MDIVDDLRFEFLIFFTKVETQQFLINEIPKKGEENFNIYFVAYRSVVSKPKTLKWALLALFSVNLF